VIVDQQLPLGLDALLSLCPCGCGRRVPSGTRGQRPTYATPACRVRAHRARTGSDVSDLAVTPSRARGEPGDCARGHFETCPRCDSPDLYVAGWVLDGSEILGTCPRCGYQPPRRAA
jgi:hypothetical protein